MGREVKRVALDFDWPLGKVWAPYLHNPYTPDDCEACGGSGHSAEYEALQPIVRLLMLAGGDAVRGEVHPYFASTPIRAPLVGLDRVTGALAGREPSWLGHDAIDGWRATNAILEAAGIDGTCSACNGEGYPPEQAERARLSEEYEPPEPPEGPGWQMWETTSEGSPISPVCETPGALAHWLADTGASSFGSSTATYDQWLRMIRGPAWAPSMVANGSGLRSGVEAAGGGDE